MHSQFKKYLYCMDTIHKRIALFLIGCVGTRLLLVYIAKHANATWLRYMGYLALLPAVGFIYIYLTGTRQTGPEVFGSKIWWNNLRPIHSLLYFLFAYNAMHGNPYSWMILFADVIFGLINFLIHHFV